VIDCKPDLLLCGHMREAALQAGRKFHFFSLQPGIPSDFSLDFFEALRLVPRTSRQITELLIGSLGLNKGTEPFFTTKNASAVKVSIERAAAKGRTSFRALAHEMRGLVAGSDKQYEHAGQALDVLQGLEIDELNPPRNGHTGPPAADFVRLLQGGEVCYFCLPVTTELKLTSSAVASLLLKLTVAVSKDLAITGTPSRRLFLAVDEFQDVASEGDLGDVISQCRGVGGGLSLLLSHQVPEQLMSEGTRALLRTAGVLLLLSPREWADQLQQWAGERVVRLRSDGFSSGRSSSADGVSWTENRSVSFQESVRSALDLDLIQDVHAVPGGAFAIVSGGRPFPIYLPFHVTQAEASRRESLAFTRRASLGGNGEASQAPAQRVGGTGVPLQEALSALFTRLRATTLSSRQGHR
jgi:hypothetical protein